LILLIIDNLLLFRLTKWRFDPPTTSLHTSERAPPPPPTPTPAAIATTATLAARVATAATTAAAAATTMAAAAFLEGWARQPYLGGWTHVNVISNRHLFVEFVHSFDINYIVITKKKPIYKFYKLPKAYVSNYSNYQLSLYSAV
jgi:hypothetical protein